MANSAQSLARLAVGLAGIVGVWLVCVAPAAAASLSSRDVQIIVKALGFLEPAPPGGTVGVIYAASDPASRADAEAIVTLFGSGLASSGGPVEAKAVDAAMLGEGKGFIAIILAAGAEATASAVGRTSGLLSISAADELVRSGRCVMAVHSQPRVDIIVNRAAARSAGVAFTSAFGMLVHEL